MPRSIMPLLLSLLALASCGNAGGVELLLEAERGEAASEAAMAEARDVIERRVRALDASGATVTRLRPNRILVRLRRGEQAAPVKALIARQGRLEFRLVDESASPEQLAAGEVSPLSQVLPYPEAGPPGRIAVRRRAIVTGRAIADARADFDWNGQPAVTIRFDAAGSRRFARATQENVNRMFAIVLDDVVLSAPVIREPILGGQAQISGGFTAETANQLAIALRSGPLPVRLAVVYERVVER